VRNGATACSPVTRQCSPGDKVLLAGTEGAPRRHRAGQGGAGLTRVLGDGEAATEGEVRGHPAEKKKHVGVSSPWRGNWR
jgi:hypothetical protein